MQLMLTLALLTSPAFAGEVSPAENAQEIPSKIDPDFQPVAKTDYVLTGSKLYRPPANNPGPMESSTSIAWGRANEFVYRTALAKDLALPGVSAGLMEDGWYSIGFSIKEGKSRVEILVHLEKKLIKLR